MSVERDRIDGGMRESWTPGHLKPVQKIQLPSGDWVIRREVRTIVEKNGLPVPSVTYSDEPCMSPEEAAAKDAEFMAYLEGLRQARPAPVIDAVQAPTEQPAAAEPKGYIPPVRTEAKPKSKKRSYRFQTVPLHVVRDEEKHGSFGIGRAMQAAYLELVLGETRTVNQYLDRSGRGDRARAEDQLVGLITSHLEQANSTWVPRMVIHGCPVKRIRSNGKSFYAVIDEEDWSLIELYDADEWSRVNSRRKLQRGSERRRQMRVPRLGRDRLVGIGA